ncbi:uncharacterized protein OCT59_028964 [Rhizophagus irregularis]|uniref:uncharacterized protein n=1 Tax=Rhizophagus irregularis TaxID=588596 RepID=UPI001DA0B7B9|nr:hypothetical protein OCT59_028964 [Rhizophagus irregularis]CAG8672232.1 19113_t:CDS:2 [Rhizophagus irregularis]
MVQALQYLGQNTDCIRHQSHYKSDQRFQPYVLPYNQQQLDMLILFSVLKQSNRQNVIFTEANTSQIPLKSNNQVEIEMKPMQLQELLESGILANTYLHIKLS